MPATEDRTLERGWIVLARSVDGGGRMTRASEHLYDMGPVFEELPGIVLLGLVVVLVLGVLVYLWLRGG